MSSTLNQSTALVDLTQKSLYISALSIAFNPTFWNLQHSRETRSASRNSPKTQPPLPKRKKKKAPPNSLHLPQNTTTKPSLSSSAETPSEHATPSPSPSSRSASSETLCTAPFPTENPLSRRPESLANLGEKPVLDSNAPSATNRSMNLSTSLSSRTPSSPWGTSWSSAAPGR
ncbi:MAG: hypothetical protein Q9167_000670 [Letrouitia subvulpina]